MDKNKIGLSGKNVTFLIVTQSEKDLEDARQAGIDLDLLDTIQALSVAERWHQHDAAANLATKLEEAKRLRDAGLQRTA